MGLTSNKVLALAVTLAVVCFVATVWLWPRLSGRNWRAVLGRIGLLMATQLMLFASVGLAANKSFLFYGSWADLLGQEQELGVVVDHSAGKSGVKVVGIAVEETPATARDTIKKTAANFPQLLDEAGEAFSKVGAERLPWTLVLDPSGKVVWFDLEYSLATRRELQQTLLALER